MPQGIMKKKLVCTYLGKSNFKDAILGQFGVDQLNFTPEIHLSDVIGGLIYQTLHKIYQFLL